MSLGRLWSRKHARVHLQGESLLARRKTSLTFSPPPSLSRAWEQRSAVKQQRTHAPSDGWPSVPIEAAPDSWWSSNPTAISFPPGETESHDIRGSRLNLVVESVLLCVEPPAASTRLRMCKGIKGSLAPLNRTSGYGRNRVRHLLRVVVHLRARKVLH